jgi:heme exporter protein B
LKDNGGEVSAFTAILRKDLLLELRSGESTITLGFLSLLILIVLTFALTPAAGDASAAAGALWAALIIAGVVGATRVLTAEWDRGCIRGLMLSPAERPAIYCAKLIAACVFMVLADLATMVLMVLFFNLDFGVWLLRLAPILVMGALGFAALALLLATIQVRIRAGDLLMPLLTLPAFVPALIAGVKASDSALAGLPFSQFAQWLKILGACDILFLACGYLLFEHVIGED